jgi:hypothetical protein
MALSEMQPRPHAKAAPFLILNSLSNVRDYNL